MPPWVDKEGGCCVLGGQGSKLWFDGVLDQRGIGVSWLNGSRGRSVRRYLREGEREREREIGGGGRERGREERGRGGGGEREREGEGEREREMERERERGGE